MAKEKATETKKIKTDKKKLKKSTSNLSWFAFINVAGYVLDAQNDTSTLIQ